MKLFAPNIAARGRALRAMAGLIILSAGFVLRSHSRLAAAICVFVAIFIFFEAARGWCAARACGIRTPL